MCTKFPDPLETLLLRNKTDCTNVILSNIHGAHASPSCSLGSPISFPQKYTYGLQMAVYNSTARQPRRRVHELQERYILMLSRCIYNANYSASNSVSSRAILASCSSTSKVSSSMGTCQRNFRLKSACRLATGIESETYGYTDISQRHTSIYRREAFVVIAEKFCASLSQVINSGSLQ